jgi:type IV pilus assembly protein PilW
MKPATARSGTRMRRVRGFTLIELMIALVIGLIVTGAALALFLTNRQTYLASENIGRVQEHARTAFELMSRNLRDAAGNACGSDVSQVNVLKDQATRWYLAWDAGIRGYDGGTAFADAAFGTSPGSRVAGTDAVEMRSFANDGVQIVSHNASSAQFKVSTINHGLNDGDIAMACDPGHGAIFQITGAQPGINDTIVHNTGAWVPGNCSKGLGGTDPALCTATGNAYTFGCLNGDKDTCTYDADPAKNQKWPAFIAKLQAERWYVGYDAAGNKVLFRSTLNNRAGVLQVDNNMIVEGVDDMALTYLVRDGAGYAAAAAGTDWSQLVAVKISLLLVGSDRIGTDGRPLQRRLEHVVALRNREP